MRGAIHKLSDVKIEARLREAARNAEQKNGKQILLGDGGGLTLQITKTAAASWLFRYMRAGKATGMGLGAYPAVTLKSARAKAEACRQEIAAGIDPLAQKRAAPPAVAPETPANKTFGDCAEAYIKAHIGEWKNAKHAQQWTNTLATYAGPVIGATPVSDVSTADIKKILDPIWTTKHETATRLRGRLESVIDWAIAHELRTGANPARWKGHLQHLLAKTTLETRTAKHHPAMPYQEVPRFLRELEGQEGMARWALEFLILTATRTSEVTGATHREIDLDKKVWIIPSQRMKAGREHRVPLTPRAVAIVKEVLPYSNGTYLFPGGRSDKPLSNMAMAMLLRRMGVSDFTVHGYRSSFRDWAAEMTNHDFRTAEEALAHKLLDKVAAAYARSDLFDKRRLLMTDWEVYCRSPQADLPTATQK